MVQKLTSKDGTHIAYTKTGAGPALILVGGAFCYRQNGNTRELAELLSPYFTVYDYDRRGRGESSDIQPYSVDREIEDLRSLVSLSGESPCVCGFSSGCGLVLKGTGDSVKFRKIVLYEPPYVAINEDDKLPVKEVKTKLENLISTGKKAQAVSYFLKRVVGVPAIFIFMFRFFNRSGWKKNEGVVRTLLYDLAVMGDLSLPPGLASAGVSPVLVIGGEKSPERLRNAVKNVARRVPNSNTLFLKGQTHNVDVKVLAPELIRFFT